MNSIKGDVGAIIVRIAEQVPIYLTLISYLAAIAGLFMIVYTLFGFIKLSKSPGQESASPYFVIGVLGAFLIAFTWTVSIVSFTIMAERVDYSLIAYSATPQSGGVGRALVPAIFTILQALGVTAIFSSFFDYRRAVTLMSQQNGMMGGQFPGDYARKGVWKMIGGAFLVNGIATIKLIENSLSVNFGSLIS